MSEYPINLVHALQSPQEHLLHKMPSSTGVSWSQVLEPRPGNCWVGYFKNTAGRSFTFRVTEGKVFGVPELASIPRGTELRRHRDELADEERADGATNEQGSRGAVADHLKAGGPYSVSKQASKDSIISHFGQQEDNYGGGGGGGGGGGKAGGPPRSSLVSKKRGMNGPGGDGVVLKRPQTAAAGASIKEFVKRKNEFEKAFNADEMKTAGRESGPAGDEVETGFEPDPLWEQRVNDAIACQNKGAVSYECPPGRANDYLCAVGSRQALNKNPSKPLVTSSGLLKNRSAPSTSGTSAGTSDRFGFQPNARVQSTTSNSARIQQRDVRKKKLEYETDHVKQSNIYRLTDMFAAAGSSYKVNPHADVYGASRAQQILKKSMPFRGGGMRDSCRPECQMKSKSSPDDMMDDDRLAEILIGQTDSAKLCTKTDVQIADYYRGSSRSNHVTDRLATAVPATNAAPVMSRYAHDKNPPQIHERNVMRTVIPPPPGASRSRARIPVAGCGSGKKKQSRVVGSGKNSGYLNVDDENKENRNLVDKDGEEEQEIGNKLMKSAGLEAKGRTAGVRSDKKNLLGSGFYAYAQQEQQARGMLSGREMLATCGDHGKEGRNHGERAAEIKPASGGTGGRYTATVQHRKLGPIFVCVENWAPAIGEQAMLFKK